jgi:hypothetical protein
VISTDITIPVGHHHPNHYHHHRRSTSIILSTHVNIIMASSTTLKITFDPAGRVDELSHIVIYFVFMKI